MTTAYRLLYDLYRAPKALQDPGDGGIIQVTGDLQICEMTSGASGETRTLANPTKAGLRFVLRLLTDGGGDVVVAAENGLNVNLENEVTFEDASDFISLVSVTLVADTSYRWEIMEGNVGATISSASVSATPSSSVSATPSSTPSSSPSATTSSSPSATPSSSPSAT